MDSPSSEQTPARVKVKQEDREKQKSDWTQWAWFAGPHEDEFTWGRYLTRQTAINEGNGFCTHERQPFYIVEARGYASEPDDEGMIQFAETRNLERVNSADDGQPRQPSTADDGREKALFAALSETRAALEWYGEQARLCRLIHSEGDAGRNALAEDGGKKAQATLTKSGELAK